jgi:hypothetical protein
MSSAIIFYTKVVVRTIASTSICSSALAGVGVKEAISREAGGGDERKSCTAPGKELPKFVRRAHTARKSTGHANDGNRLVLELNMSFGKS